MGVGPLGEWKWRCPELGPVPGTERVEGLLPAALCFLPGKVGVSTRCRVFAACFAVKRYFCCGSARVFLPFPLYRVPHVCLTWLRGCGWRASRQRWSGPPSQRVSISWPWHLLAELRPDPEAGVAVAVLWSSRLLMTDEMPAAAHHSRSFLSQLCSTERTRLA